MIVNESEEWDQAGKIMRAFTIGKAEANAVSHLMTRVNAGVLEELKAAVRQRGMTSWMSHDVVFTFTVGFSSGSGRVTAKFEQWDCPLTNKPDDVLVLQYLERLKRDFDRQPIRKAWTLKDAVDMHSYTGCFLHLMEQLKAEVPSSDLAEAMPQLQNQFFSGYLDAELEHVLEVKTPTTTCADIGFLRQVFKIRSL